MVEKDYNVIASATDGKEAFRIIKDKKPDIAILENAFPIRFGKQWNSKTVDTFNYNRKRRDQVDSAKQNRKRNRETNVNIKQNYRKAQKPYYQ